MYLCCNFSQVVQLLWMAAKVALSIAGLSSAILPSLGKTSSPRERPGPDWLPVQKSYPSCLNVPELWRQELAFLSSGSPGEAASSCSGELA